MRVREQPLVEIRIGDGDIEVLSWDGFEERVAAGRVPDHALVRFEPVTGEGFVPAAQLDLVQSMRRDAAVAWQARFTRGGAPVVTALLVGVQIRIWLYTLRGEQGTSFTYALLNWLPPALEDGETWRVVGGGLLHTDFLHALLNLIWLGYTGWNIERALGWVNLLTLFFFSVVTGGLMSMFLTPASPSLGASGGVFGLVCASVVFGLVRQDLLPERGRRLFGVALVPYLVLMFWGGLQNETTDNWAHFGGLVGGGLLAFLLDPPEFERRRGQNLAVRLTALGGSLALLVGLGLFGPAVHPLLDKEEARLAALPPAARKRAADLPIDLLTELTWSVPAGWKASANLARDPVFRSPIEGTRRSFAVVQLDAERPLSPDALVQRWTESLGQAHDGVQVQPVPVSADWQGRPAEQVRALQATVDTPIGPVRLDFLGTTRGMVGFYRVHEVELAQAERLEPLFARLDRTIDWREPLGLQAARRAVDTNPTSARARASLAAELARWGEPAQALGLQRALVEERPVDPERWLALLATVGAYPAEADAVAEVDRALRALPVPRVVVQAAATLRDRGEGLAADGLLGLAWNHAPDDRELRRALRRAGLPTAVEIGPAGPVAAALGWLPDDAARPSRQVSAWLGEPLTVDAARRWGALARAERDALGERLPAALARGRGVILLLRIRDGVLHPDPTQIPGLERDLVAALDGEFASWMPASVQAVLADRGTVEALLAQLDPEASP